MLELPARRFTEVTGILLALATGVLGLGLERLARGSRLLGAILISIGGLVTLLAFSLRVEGDPSEQTLLLVTREECAHCEEARAIVQDKQAELGFSLWEVDVTQDEQLRDRWVQQVPVLVKDGEVFATLEVRPGDVDEALQTGRETAETAGEKANP